MGSNVEEAEAFNNPSSYRICGTYFFVESMLKYAKAYLYLDKVRKKMRF